MLRMFTLFSVAAGAALLVACDDALPDDGAGGSQGGSAPLTVKTDHGEVKGALEGATRQFLGIPFAAPPVGPLRWKPPADHAPWTAPLDASKTGPQCAQLDPLSGAFVDLSSEDCLTLNVWAPSRPKSEKLPVMVWIHGGGYVLGSGGDPAYDGHNLSEATGVIVVSINYRLGPFGFLSLPALRAEDASVPSSGNYGLQDQRAALAWVKANAAAFGGDPANITVFGESAGGASACQHLVAPRSKGLVARAIIESGPCDLVSTKDAADTQGKTFTDALGCKQGDDAAVLACVRGKTTEELAIALPLSKDFISAGGATWNPVVDGFELPDRPSALLASGAFEKVPTILGYNSDEAALFFVLGNTKIADDAALAAFAETIAPGHGAEIASHYPSSAYGSAQDAAEAAVTDAGFLCPTKRMAKAFAKAGAPTFLYHFAYVPMGGFLGDIGSFHSGEIRYVLGDPSQLLPLGLTDDEKAFSSVIQGYWTRHAANGDPNGGAFAWPRYDGASDQAIVLDATLSTESGHRAEQCAFWDGLAVVI
ncbi:MAG: carboxylesterase family protein [Polyangiaceae bacterium]